MMTSQTKQALLAAVALAVIGAAGFWIYKKNFATKPYTPSVKAHTAVGEVLAEETIKLIGQSGQIVVVTLEDGRSREADVNLQAFEDGLKKSSIKIVRTDTIGGDKAKYGAGSGMSGRRFVRVVTKYPDVSAIVSLVGLPDADEEELKELKGKPGPKILAFARDSKHLPELFKKQCLDVAIVPRIEASKAPAKPKTPREWFDRQFEIVRATR